MKLAQFFARILNRETVAGTAGVAGAAPVHASDASTPHAVTDSLETIVSGFSSIQSLLKDDESVELPASALLAPLPEAMRGPAWQNGPFPDTCLLVDQKSLYEQLQKGRLQYTVEQFRKDVPPGWLNPEAKGLVDLDLAQVVDAMPPEFFGDLAPASSEMREISGMHDYFTPKQPVVAPPAVPVVPVAAPATPAAVTVPSPVPAPQPIVPPVVPTPVAATIPVAAIPTAPIPVAPVAVPAVVVAAAQPVVELPLPAVQPAPVPPPVPAPQSIVPPVAPAPVAATVPSAATPAATTPIPEPMTAPVVAPPAVVAAAIPEVAPVAIPLASRTEPEPEGAISAAAPAAAKPELVSPGWDGVETRLDAGGQSVDINLATLEDLLRLRGIGPSRAKQLLEYRQSIGRFNSIFDLAKVPGLGGAAFSKLTGLSLKLRLDRHQALNQTLALPAGTVPSLADLIVAITAVTGAAAGVLTNHDGMPLAVHGMEAEEAEANAALTPQLFRRIGGYLRRFQPRIDGDALILPGSQGQLLLLSGDSICLILRFTRPISRIACRKALQIQDELDWLLGIRAVVKAG